MKKVNSVSKGNYIGYLWRSNASEAEIINGDFSESLDPAKNPFIVEAQLYDVSKMLSYSIKYVDGKYIILEHQVVSSDFNSSIVEIMEFCSNRIKGNPVLRFLQYWSEQEDNLCGMNVLQPQEFVFVGFKVKED